MARLLLLNGPNLNLLGSREPALYGTDTLESIESRAARVARESGHELIAFQSNAEHELIERIHRARSEGIAFMIVNPAAFTHTSLALRDAILASGLPFIEVHLSNTHAREAFRRHSYFSDIAVGVIAGLGAFGYEAAVHAAAQRFAGRLSTAPPSRSFDPWEPLPGMDIRKIKKLIELLEESGIAEIEIKEGEEAVRISRMPTGNAAAQLLPQPPPVAALPGVAPAAAPAATAALAPAESVAKPKPNEHVITAPMVGTFYASPSPGAKPFVEIGDEIKVGQVLCIIEAMKMMNQIEADRAGRVASVMARNGDPVEFGQPLFVVE